MTDSMIKPQTLQDVSLASDSLESFGRSLRDWIHAIGRGADDIATVVQIAVSEEPPLLAQKFGSGEIADVYLAAYADWLCEQCQLALPDWTWDPENRSTLELPWFADNARASLLVLSPAAFRVRNLFTIPEWPFGKRKFAV